MILAIAIAIAIAIANAIGIGAYVIGRHALALADRQLGVLITTAVVVNTGYLGLPMAVVLLHARALGTAVAYDQLICSPALPILGFGVGAAFRVHGEGGQRVGIRAVFLRNPPLMGVIAGLLAPRLIRTGPATGRLPCCGRRAAPAGVLRGRGQPVRRTPRGGRALCWGARTGVWRWRSVCGCSPRRSSWPHWPLRSSAFPRRPFCSQRCRAGSIR